MVTTLAFDHFLEENGIDGEYRRLVRTRGDSCECGHSGEGKAREDRGGVELSFIRDLIRRANLDPARGLGRVDHAAAVELLRSA